MALLAQLAQDPGEPALVPGGDDLACGELLARVHAHVQRSVIGVGEAALARVDLHRGHAEVEIDAVGPYALLGEQRERLGIAAADEAHGARDLVGELHEALLSLGVAVDRDECPFRPKALGDHARMSSPAKGAVDRQLAGLGVEQLEQLLGEHGDVRGGHVKQDGQRAR